MHTWSERHTKYFKLSYAATDNSQAPIQVNDRVMKNVITYSYILVMNTIDRVMHDVKLDIALHPHMWL